jgi:hypothetical protein
VAGLHHEGEVFDRVQVGDSLTLAPAKGKAVEGGVLDKLEGWLGLFLGVVFALVAIFPKENQTEGL